MENKVFNIRTGLIASFVLLIVFVAALAYVIIAPLFTETGPRSRTQVFSPGTSIIVPATVTAGQPFIYSATGEKLVNAGAEIKIQLTCILADGSSSLIQVGEIYSGVGTGPIKIKRSMVIPNNQRYFDSEDCTLQFYGTYNLYQTKLGGEEQALPIPALVNSNHFKFIVPEQ